MMIQGTLNCPYSLQLRVFLRDCLDQSRTRSVLIRKICSLFFILKLVRTWSHLGFKLLLHSIWAICSLNVIFQLHLSLSFSLYLHLYLKQAHAQAHNTHTHAHTHTRTTRTHTRTHTNTYPMSFLVLLSTLLQFYFEWNSMERCFSKQLL